MTLERLCDHLANRLPMEQIPLTWHSTGYTSEAFNRWASDSSFPGWTGDRPTEDEARIIVQLLEAQPGHSLLDVACGYGRHALLLASQYGLEVTGIDVSPGLIAAAKRLADERGRVQDQGRTRGSPLLIGYEVRHARDLPYIIHFLSSLQRTLL
jgi:SAM-dependent methyltransferase